LAAAGVRLISVRDLEGAGLGAGTGGEVRCES
jgi:hypothetical protein